MSRTVAIRSVVLLAMLLVAFAVTGVWHAGRDAAARQDVALLEVGAGPIGEPSLRFVARALYGPERLQLIGYVIEGTNLDPFLYTGKGDPGIATARLTLTADLTGLDQIRRADVRTIVGAGELRIYLGDGGADWNDPASFADGELLATYALDLSESLQRQDPTVGVVVGDGDMTQNDAAEFALENATYRFGATGIVSRIRYTGALIGGESGDGSVAADVTGTLTVVDRPARAVPLGGSSTPTP